MGVLDVSRPLAMDNQYLLRDIRVCSELQTLTGKSRSIQLAGSQQYDEFTRGGIAFTAELERGIPLHSLFCRRNHITRKLRRDKFRQRTEHMHQPSLPRKQ